MKCSLLLPALVCFSLLSFAQKKPPQLLVAEGLLQTNSSKAIALATRVYSSSVKQKDHYTAALASLLLSDAYRSETKYDDACYYDSIAVALSGTLNDPGLLKQAIVEQASNLTETGAFIQAEQVLNLHKNLFIQNPTVETSRWYLLQGNWQFKQMQFGKAIAYYREGLAIANEAGDKTIQMLLKMFIGRTLIYQGQSDSISLAYEALEYFTASGNYRYASQSAGAIAFALQQSFNIESAYTYNKQSLEYAITAANGSLQAEAKIRIGDNLLAKKSYKEAEAMFLAAENFYSKHHLPMGLASANVRLGMLYTEMDKYELAASHFNEVEKQNEFLKLAVVKIGVAGGRTKLQIKMKNYKAADSIATGAMDLTAKIVDKQLLSTVLKKANEGKLIPREDLKTVDSLLNPILSKLVKGQSTVSDSGYQKLLSLNMYTGTDVAGDSTLIAKSSRQLLQLETQYKTKSIADSLRMEKLQLVANKKDLKTRDIVVVSTAVLLLLVSVGLWFQYYTRRRAEKDKDRIELLKNEVHHRVTNNLAVINRLVEVAGNNSIADAPLSALKTRIKSIELLHRHLYTNEGKSGNISLQAYFDDLCAAITATFKSAKDIRILVTANAEVESAIAEKLGLILNELVTNSFKYAFDNKDAGTITIAAHRQGRQLNLMVEDNGIGIEKPGSKKSYGMKLIKGLSHELNGKFSFESSAGTQFKLVIPV